MGSEHLKKWREENLNTPEKRRQHVQAAVEAKKKKNDSDRQFNGLYVNVRQIVNGDYVEGSSRSIRLPKDKLDISVDDMTNYLYSYCKDMVEKKTRIRTRTVSLTV